MARFSSALALVGALLCVGSGVQVSTRSSTKVGVKVKARSKLGVMSKAGVTRYSRHKIRAVESHKEFYWSSAGGAHGRMGTSAFAGPVDLTDNISWGWHHPNGIYNTVPVGGPLLDDQMNIYVSSDDAVRKIDTLGGLMWIYAPRGQMAASPSLVSGTDSLRLPTNDNKTSLSVGEIVEVLPGKAYEHKGREYYRAGDLGEVTRIVANGHSDDLRAMVKWARTNRSSTVRMSSWQQKFVRARKSSTSLEQTPTSALYGTTTEGYVFAIDLATGDELWATKVCGSIAGVKGSVGTKGGVLVVATDRCTNRYCYRYRNETNNMMPSNLVVRGLSSMDGSPVWSFKPDSPVWNFVPHFTDAGAVIFQDFEGAVYSLDATTGALRWKQAGHMGTYTQAAAAYSAEENRVFSIAEDEYKSRYCSPYRPPGILHWCNTVQWTQTVVRGFDATTGDKRWEKVLPMPPAGASVGKLNSGGGRTSLVIGLGLSCSYLGSWGDISKPGELWVLDAKWGGFMWKRTGPTLWTPDCAGDREGADIRRAMGTRSKCQPNSWTSPVIDAAGDVYVGNHVGVLQKWGSTDGSPSGVDLLSTLNTGSALPDQSIAMAPGMMAVATCNALIVLES